MKRADLVKRLRGLQAEAYGALPTAERVGQACLDKYEKNSVAARVCYEHGSLQATTRFLALDIDTLIEDLCGR